MTCNKTACVSLLNTFGETAYGQAYVATACSPPLPDPPPGLTPLSCSLPGHPAHHPHHPRLQPQPPPRRQRRRPSHCLTPPCREGCGGCDLWLEERAVWLFIILMYLAAAITETYYAAVARQPSYALQSRQFRQGIQPQWIASAVQQSHLSPFLSPTPPAPTGLRLALHYPLHRGLRGPAQRQLPLTIRPRLRLPPPLPLGAPVHELFYAISSAFFCCSILGPVQLPCNYNPLLIHFMTIRPAQSE